MQISVSFVITLLPFLFHIFCKFFCVFWEIYPIFSLKPLIFVTFSICYFSDRPSANCTICTNSIFLPSLLPFLKKHCPVFCFCYFFVKKLRIFLFLYLYCFCITIPFIFRKIKKSGFDRIRIFLNIVLCHYFAKAFLRVATSCFNIAS